MAKKAKTTRRRRSTKASSGSYKQKLAKVAMIAAGVAVGKIVKDKFTPTVAQTAGIDGDSSSKLLAAGIAAAGIAGSVMLKNNYVKDIALGVGVAGAASLINDFAGKALVSLGDTDEPMMIPSQAEVYPSYEPAVGGYGKEVISGNDPVFAGVGDTNDMILS